MLLLNIQLFAVVTVIFLNLSVANGWFERSNYQVDLQPNAIFPLESLLHRRDSSYRVAFVGPVGTNLFMICHINYSRGCLRGRRITRRGRCCDDFFYVGYDLHPNIRGAIRYCGIWDETRREKKPIIATSRPTIGQPVLVVGMTNANSFS